MARRLGWVCLGWAGAWLLAVPAHAEWATQTLTLQPGWNAVFLEVQPADNLCDTVFEGVPIKSAWKWNRKLQLQQFVKNPNELLPKDPDWLIYFPKGEARSFLTDLHAVNAGEPYLIELGGSEPFTWTLHGRAGAPALAWLPDSFNLAGFYMDPAADVTVKDFLKYDSALAGQAVYRVTPEGKAVKVDAAAAKMKRGEAFWVYSKGNTSYAGPFSAAVESGKALDFGKSAKEGALLVTNKTDQPKTVTVQLAPSERPAAAKGAKDGEGDATPLPPLAGDVQLSYGKLIGWAPLPERLEFTVPANSTQRLPLAVRRAVMRQAASANKSAIEGGQFESVLQVSDGSASLFRLPVRAEAAVDYTGLWVGNVTLTKVSEVARPNDLTATAASSEFNFRVIIHVDELDNVSLLQKVYLMREEQTVDNSVPPRVVRPERYVLLTRDELLTGLTGIAIRDGKFVGRRITAPAFSEVDLDNDGSFDPVPMTGTVGTTPPNNTLTATITVDYNDPLNPFVHRFHPDHDNLDERFENPIAEGNESYTFQRALQLIFEEQDPEQLGLPEWGDTLIGGTYREEITGVHKRTIRVEGTFRLSRVSGIGSLNDVP